MRKSCVDIVLKLNSEIGLLYSYRIAIVVNWAAIGTESACVP
jgi:hypothetical protein